MYNSVAIYSPNEKPISLEDLSQGNIKLNPGIYTLVFNEFNKNYEINYTNQNFKLPKKIYGKAPQYARHFIEAYKIGDNNLGVLLTGEKGTGKSELSHLTCNMAIEDGYPIVVIYGTPEDDVTRLIEFIENLGDVVIFLDEFGKNFSIYTQDKLLPLLSSSSNGKKLFLITENNYYSLSNFIRSRPGRARYHIEFKRLEPEVITEYLEDKLIDKQFAQELLNFYNRSATFTFDYLKTIVEEHLMFPDKSFQDLVKFLNIDELKKKYVMVVKDVYIVDNTKNPRELIPVKYEQAFFPQNDNFKAGNAIRLIVFKDIVNEKGENIRREQIDRINLTIKDVINVKNSNYLLKKITSKNTYEIKMEEMDENKKTELLERKLMSVPEEQGNMYPGGGGLYL